MKDRHQKSSWPFGVLALVVFVLLVMGARYAVVPVPEQVAFPVTDQTQTLIQRFPETVDDYKPDLLLLPNGTFLNVVKVIGPQAQEQGLSGVTRLADNEGMLFSFDRADIYTFWMKDMLIPIDILWLGRGGTIVHMQEHALPSSYPEMFTPAVPAWYVLEVADGFVEKHHLSVGDTFNIISSSYSGE